MVFVSKKTKCKWAKVQTYKSVKGKKNKRVNVQKRKIENNKRNFVIYPYCTIVSMYLSTIEQNHHSTLFPLVINLNIHVSRLRTIVLGAYWQDAILGLVTFAKVKNDCCPSLSFVRSFSLPLAVPSVCRFPLPE